MASDSWQDGHQKKEEGFEYVKLSEQGLACVAGKVRTNVFPYDRQKKEAKIRREGGMKSPE